MNKAEIEQWHEDHPYGARTEYYIDEILLQIKRLWLENPQQRLGQLVENSFPDLYNVNDECWFDGTWWDE